MKENDSELHKKVVILGSFRKHFKEIQNALDCFLNNGFEVLSPAKASIVNPNGDFVLLNTDSTDNPRILEDAVLRKMKEADIVYICNVDGYIGISTAFELGNSVDMWEKVYFLNMYTDEVSEVFGDYFDKSKIISPSELCKKWK